MVEEVVGAVVEVKGSISQPPSFFFPFFFLILFLAFPNILRYQVCCLSYLVIYVYDRMC